MVSLSLSLSGSQPAMLVTKPGGWPLVTEISGCLHSNAMQYSQLPVTPKYAGQHFLTFSVGFVLLSSVTVGLIKL